MDPGEGFEPPEALLAVAPPLVLSEARLTPPVSVYAAERVPLAVPWPEGFETDPPQLREPGPLGAKPCRRQHYLSHEARPQLTLMFEYDAQGRVIYEGVDEHTDGTTDHDHRYVWGVDGRPSQHDERVASKPTCDGVDPEVRRSHVYRYDRHGMWLGGEQRFDGFGGTSTRWSRTEYDGAGRPARWIDYQSDSLEGAQTLQWDDQSRLTEHVFYVGTDVLMMRRWYYGDGERYQLRWAKDVWSVSREVLDGEGRVVLEQHDRDGDGAVDESVRRIYDDQGVEQRRQIDADVDGIFETSVEIRYDAQGRRSEELTTGAGGEARQTWRYDEGGRLVRWSNTRGDTWAEDFEEHVYDGQGREVERTSERYKSVNTASDLSHYVEREHWTREFDEQGRLVRESVLEGLTGPDERVEYIYDCREAYRRYPWENPLEHPETAAECMDFE